MSKMPLVMLVDDFEDAREMYCSYLAFRGLQVLCAEGGGQAIAYAREHRPDLILMDLRMPGVSGFEAMRTLRADPQFTKVPIVALTALALQSERQAASTAGFDAVIAKPCLPDELFHIIAELLAIWRPELGPLGHS